MTYISAMLTENRRNVIVWSRTDQGVRDYRTYPAPYYFYVADKEGEFKDIYGKKVSKMEFSNNKEFYDAKESCKNNNIKLYESDISPEYKILSEHYYNKPVGKLNITFYDIEVDKDVNRGYATIDNPYASIISVALYHQHSDKYVYIAVPPDNSWTVDKFPKDMREQTEIILCKDEKELLRHFLVEIEDSDVISGWNNSMFDDPYTYSRIQIQLGEEYANKLSFPSARSPELKEVEVFKVMQKTLKIYGRVSLDYLSLYKKLEQEMKPSYMLEAIADELLPDLPKLTYEGPLHLLYRNDFIYFSRYNLRDTEILKGLNDKLKYVETAIEFTHSNAAQIDTILGTIKLLETGIINECHYNFNTIVPDVNKDEVGGGTFVGALVLDPQRGLHKMGSAVDIVSLYPSTMRSLNISPETIIGQFIEYQEAYEAFYNDTPEIHLTLNFENGFSDTNTVAEWKAMFKEKKWAISGYGTVYNQSSQGFIPSILTDWFTKRKEFKGKVKDAYKKMEGFAKNSKEYLDLKKYAEYCDKMQYIFKIKLNSIYGILGNAYCRFYDIRSAQSVTRSGQRILLHQVHTTAKLLDGEYKYPSRSVIYGDTDSTMFQTHADNIEDAIYVCEAVVKAVNKSLPIFTRKAFLCNVGFDDLIKSEYEYIFDGGIFVEKKLYALHLIYKDGKACDKMKIMGLQIKKTTLPKHVRIKLVEFVESILKGKDWAEVGLDIIKYKDELYNMDLLQIGLPKGIKKIEEYTDRYNIDNDTDLPGHVAAAMFWNKCLEEYKDKENIKITTGSKLKIFYFTKTFGRFKSIALPTDLRTVPEWFTKYYYNLVDKKCQITKLVDDPLKNIVGAIGKTIPTKKTLLVDELVEY